jgi:hypothetical protein
MKTLSLKLSDDLHAMLKASAEALGMPKSDLVRRAIQTYLASQQGACLTCADLAGELIGSLDGPCDLATSSENFHHYGD